MLRLTSPLLNLALGLVLVGFAGFATGCDDRMQAFDEAKEMVGRTLPATPDATPSDPVDASVPDHAADAHTPGGGIDAGDDDGDDEGDDGTGNGGGGGASGGGCSAAPGHASGGALGVLFAALGGLVVVRRRQRA